MNRLQSAFTRLATDEPIPYALIGRVVECRVKEHLERAAAKRGTSKRGKK